MAFTKEQKREYYKEHKEEINAKRKAKYKSNTEVRDANTRMNMANLAACLHYICTKSDLAGKLISASDLRSKYGNKYIDLANNGWSEPLVINEVSLGKSYGVTKYAVTNHLDLLENSGYIEFIDWYLIKNAKYKSKVYVCNLKKMDEDFNNEFFDIYEQIGINFFKNITIEENEVEETKESIKRNNKCMQYKFWHHVKEEVEEWNSYIPYKFRTKFLNKNEDGDYIDGRCYNIICSSKNPEKHPEDKERMELLKEIYGDTNYIELDVNSNILRINYNLIHNESFPIDKDVYYELLKNMGIEMSEQKFKDSGAREIIKLQFMPIYMKPQSVYIKQKRVDELTDLNLVQKNTLYEDVKTIFGIEYKEFIGRLKEAIYRFLSIDEFDKQYRVQLGSMYFKFETAVATKMNLKFRKLGIESINVYDGFYFKENTITKDLFYKVFHEAIMDVKKDMNTYNYNLDDCNCKKEIKYFTYTNYKVNKPIHYNNQSTYNTNIQIPKQNSETKDNHYLEEEKNNILKQLGVEEYDEENDF